MTEIWRTIPGWEGLYEVSDLGRVRSLGRWVAPRGRRYFFHGRVLKGAPDSDGYLGVGLRDGQRKRSAKVHHLVLEAFVGPAPDGTQCRHGDGKRVNNCRTNLSWGTALANHDDKRRHGTIARGSRIHCSQLSEEQVREIRRRVIVDGEKQRHVANRFSVTELTVRHILIRHTWRHVGDGLEFKPRRKANPGSFGFRSA